MRTLKIVLAYDGTDFVGWQRQPTGASIQGHLERALASIEGNPVTVIGAGRTDAGVHALGQVASCTLSHPIAPATLARALNAMLPEAIRVRLVEDVADGFHARYSARLKTYRYLIGNGTPASPFARRYAWHVPQPLDGAAMAVAARLLEGEHDFAALQAAGSATKTTTRTMTAVTVWTCSEAHTFGSAFLGAPPATGGRIVAFEVTGTGFLRHMVRNTVGTLVEIGLGRRVPGWMGELLAGRDRSRSGPTAPAHGLFLVSVDYGASRGPGPEPGTGRRPSAPLEAP